MRYTTDKRYILTDNTSKVAVYEANYALEAQRRYAFKNAVAFLLASLLVITAIASI